jgi:hypothetical protein
MSPDNALSSSETWVRFYETTQCNIPEENHLHTHRRTNVKWAEELEMIGKGSLIF